MINVTKDVIQCKYQLFHLLSPERKPAFFGTNNQAERRDRVFFFVHIVMFVLYWIITMFVAHWMFSGRERMKNLIVDSNRDLDIVYKRREVNRIHVFKFAQSKKLDRMIDFISEKTREKKSTIKEMHNFIVNRTPNRWRNGMTIIRSISRPSLI